MRRADLRAAAAAVLAALALGLTSACTTPGFPPVDNPYTGPSVLPPVPSASPTSVSPTATDVAKQPPSQPQWTGRTRPTGSAGVARLVTGQTHTMRARGIALEYTVFEIRDDIRSAVIPQGARWVGADAQVCFRALPAEVPYVTLGWSPWQAVGSDGQVYRPAERYYEGLPLPPYPMHEAAGRFVTNDCVRGWIVFAVDRGRDVSGVRVTMSEVLEGLAAEWRR